ncbi:MAG: PD-(D/E)XK nuclease family protein [Clostridia bacterium]|nr:PD-(D/E)XK nuclease family protein [Clostridia bacterium]
MEKICVIQGDSLQDVLRAAGKLMPADFLQKNVVVSPFAKRGVESHLFAARESDVLFGTEITNLNAFLCKKLGKQTISHFQKMLLVRGALKSLKGQLKVLGGKITKGLVQGICDEISRFQENGISPQMLVAKHPQDILLAEKVADLAKIYQKYLDALGEKFDDFALAQKFLAQEKLDLQNHNIFFVGYYEISKVQKQILKKFVEYGAKVFVGVCKSENKNNGYIYNNLLENLRKDFDIVLFPAASSQSENQHIVKNIAFSVNDEKSNLDFMQIFEANDVQTEVQNAARMIKALLQSGKAKGGEIAVICANLSAYAPVIENQFSAFGLNFYINQPNSLLNSPLAGFVQNVLVWRFYQKSDALLNVMLSDFSGLSNHEKIAVQQHFTFFGDDATKCFRGTLAEKPIDAVLQKFAGLSEDANCVAEIINHFALDQKILSLPQKFISQQKNALAKIQQIAEDILGFDFSKEEFFDVFCQALSNANISNLPAQVDAVWVDDISHQISPAKFLFVLGVNQGAAPAVTADTMILSDSNLDALSLDMVGTVLAKNRSARFDVFSNILNFEIGLYISYSLTDFSGQKLLPSGFVKTFAQCAEKDILTILSKTNFAALEEMTDVEKANFFARFVGTRENAQQLYLKFLQDPNPHFDCLMPSLGQMFEQKIEDDAQFEIDTEKLFFPEGKTKVSQIESYYSCPFKHFLAYGLKLTEPQTAQLQSFDVGNLLHKVAEVFLQPQNNFCKRQKNEIFQIVDDIFQDIKNDKSFAKLFLEKNKFSLQILRAEALRLCTYLFDAYHKSNFHPKFLEVYFGAKQTFKLRVLDKDFSLVGIVDRVDTYQNNAVIIDYKTGSSVKGSDGELFYGEKLQIFVYAKALAQLQNLNIQGVFYFPILNKYSEEKSHPYMLRGKNVLAQEFLLNFDNTLSLENPKSTIFPCEIKTSKEALKNPEMQFNTRHGNHLAKETLDDMMDYAIAMTTQGIQEILQGNIALLPNENACGFCPYLAICQRPENLLVREKVFDVNSGHFALWKGGE